MTTDFCAGRARIVFLVRVPVERTSEFLAAYQQIRYEVADGVDGHLVDQVCRAGNDPEQWLITSEWRSLAAFEAWECTDAHRRLVKPLRECIAEAQSLRFTVEAETRRGDRPDLSSTTPPAGSSPAAILKGGLS